jgi:hypothetical protein
MGPGTTRTCRKQLHRAWTGTSEHGRGHRHGHGHSDYGNPMHIYIYIPRSTIHIQLQISLQPDSLGFWVKRPCLEERNI